MEEKLSVFDEPLPNHRLFVLEPIANVPLCRSIYKVYNPIAMRTSNEMYSLGIEKSRVYIVFDKVIDLNKKGCGSGTLKINMFQSFEPAVTKRAHSTIYIDLHPKSHITTSRNSM